MLKAFTSMGTTRWTSAVLIPLMIVLGSLGLAISSITYGASIFEKPTGVAVDSGGNVFVVDSGNARIQKFQTYGSFIRMWGSLGIGEGQFNNPSGIAIDSSNNVYVTEIGNNRIQKFSNTGDYLGQWGTTCRVFTGENCSDPDGNNGPLSKGDGQFYNPAGITIDKSGNVYVADTGNHRIQKFTSTGKFLGKWGTFGNKDGQFKFPMDITIDSSGYAYVADRDNHRIQKFVATFGLTSGKIAYGVFVHKWGTEGTDEDTQFKGPVGIDHDNSQNVYVTDSGNDRVKKFSNVGSPLTQWGNYHFRGIALDPSSTFVYTTDMNNHRVEQYKSNGAFNTSWGPIY